MIRRSFAVRLSAPAAVAGHQFIFHDVLVVRNLDLRGEP
jgi:hypothetical protein